MTKNDLYAYLITEGVNRGYEVIPEFVVEIDPADIRKIDLVWATRRSHVVALDANRVDFYPAFWERNKVFEIEGCNIPRMSSANQGISRHIHSFDFIRAVYGNDVGTYVVLYTEAYDRQWEYDRDRSEKVDNRIEWGEKNGVCVVDGDDIREVIPPFGN